MKLLEKIKKLNGRQKAEFVIASVLTVVFMIALPAYAWFSSNRNLETITKIKEPGDIFFRSGRAISLTDADPIVHFEMQDIDIEAISKGTPKRYVFSVMPGGYKVNYDLQLAHTTNIPFTYKLYKATESKGLTTDQITAGVNNGTLTVYHPRDDVDNKTYYSKGAEVFLTPLNLDNGTYGRKLAQGNDAYYSNTYDQNDEPELYAIPVYLQTTGENYIKHTGDSGDYDYYILELGWDNNNGISNPSFEKWNNAKNTKETDMIYITASIHLG